MGQESSVDCALHDLRQVFSDVEVKVADPLLHSVKPLVRQVAFSVTRRPQMGKCTVDACRASRVGAWRRHREREVSVSWDKRELGDFFRSKYDWDLLAARNAWSFGADTQGPNVLLDDTLPMDVNKALLGTCRDHVVQGFQWGCRQGPSAKNLWQRQI